MSSKYLTLFIKLLLIIICLKFSNQTTFIDPLNPVYIPSDRVISLSDSNDAYKFVWFNYVMSQSGTNYLDRRNGEVYQGKPVNKI